MFSDTVSSCVNAKFRLSKKGKHIFLQLPQVKRHSVLCFFLFPQKQPQSLLKSQNEKREQGASAYPRKEFSVVFLSY